MRLEDLDSNTVRSLGTPENIERAQELVEKNQVRYRYRLPDRLQAGILDNNVFRVEVLIEDNQLKYNYPYPWEGESWSPYALAVLWAWVSDPDSFLQRNTLKERLKQYSKNELVRIILELADRVLEVREILKQENPELEDILESIDQIMAEISESETPALAKVEDKLRRVQIHADRLSQSGRLSEARAIYFYILDNILGLEEDRGQVDLLSAELKQELYEEYCQLIHEDRHLDRQLVQQEIEQLESRPLAAQSSLDFTEIKKAISERH
ncbi:MAG: hypothetical protein JRI57_04785 [Deltaproteobacteria bacterium]|nr:hypothetical protein [Deltaproteobacteria bacterium]MBW1952567.1 hypothetical protein [Deltaproteobacteria bacterium]MBW1986134.1 hypothetical protein [Deltaproteobacteria bacterium]MBW2134180.1 hypothetical protein [Deltaproteobacteria bacterium]